ncbi:MAG: aminopeptidase [Candidatus Aminicenantes bacterium]|nr:aminopeptidase [Candidatus Aminicenantes bacterium]NIM83190.1 aminopeptidase [Candidatus Aminicenantes bacterium]NIN22569.1 aminopeptidase [Candidatus Aminicenantes bacterium]NIN46338.1 aminopeptidase [Candidatus Aminicenantes bacterium]NIN89179.1 aminopeptidase [Candidatus Aminicenantes bacterium]
MSENKSLNNLIGKYTFKFFKNNAKLDNKQQVLIITDDKIDANVTGYLRKAAAKITGKIDIYILSTPPGSNFEPPLDLKKKVQNSDVILAPTSSSLFHTELIREACEKGAKFFAMTGATLETLYKGAATADFIGLEPGVIEKANVLTRSNSIKITTKRGTNFSANISGRLANAETGIGKKGKPATFPDIEINTSIIENSGNGKIIIDGSIGPIGVLQQPVSLTVENGKIVEIKGGTEAEKLKSLITTLNDENMYQIAEIGIGLNSNGSIRGVIIEDESTLGTAHIGIGNNIFMGGKNRAKSHIDLVFKDPKIYLDGKLFIDGKKHLF